MAVPIGFSVDTSSYEANSLKKWSQTEGFVRIVAKLGKQTIEWLGKIYESFGWGLDTRREDVSQLHDAFSITNTVCQLTEIPGALYDIGKDIGKIKKAYSPQEEGVEKADEKTWQLWTNLTAHVSDGFSVIKDGFIKLFLRLDEPVKNALGQTGFVLLDLGMSALFINKVSDIIEYKETLRGLTAESFEGKQEVCERAKALLQAKITNDWIKVAKFVSLFTLGIFGMLSLFGGVSQIAGIAIGTYILFCSTLALMATITAKFHEIFSYREAAIEIAKKDGQAGLLAAKAHKIPVPFEACRETLQQA